MDEHYVTDLYQASYFLMNGCELIGVECIPTGGVLCCRIGFRGEGLGKLSAQWFEKRAVANLWVFRNAYNQINSYVHQAKRNYKDAPRRRAEGGSL
jgi:hypothetical protein